MKTLARIGGVVFVEVPVLLQHFHMFDVVFNHIVQDLLHQIIVFSSELLILLIKLVGPNSLLLCLLLAVHSKSFHLRVILRYREFLEKREWRCAVLAPYDQSGLCLPEFLRHLIEGSEELHRR